MIFFDASEVFASLLSCPTLNQDKNYFFDCTKDPFVAPQTTSYVGDIHPGCCYRMTYEALIKKFGVDMLLPCIMAMDKTHIDMAGRLQMEPITILHGLLNHVVRRLPIAMRILGYINHSTPVHLPSASEHDSELNVPADLSKGTLRVKDPLKRHPNASWSTYILNETHMQIQFILEESGFLRLQKHGFRWDLHYNKKIYPVVFHPYVPFIIGDTEGHDRLCGHYTARFSQISQLCRICECPTYLTGYSKSKFPHRLPKKSTPWCVRALPISSSCCRRTILRMDSLMFDLVCTISAAFLVPVLAKCFTWFPLVGSNTACWPLQPKPVQRLWH